VAETIEPASVRSMTQQRLELRRKSPSK